jgi:uncharacterized membrane protein
MSDLVFIAFENEKKPEEVRDRVLGMQKEYLIELAMRSSPPATKTAE